jgi:hypothetical protein
VIEGLQCFLIAEHIFVLGLVEATRPPQMLFDYTIIEYKRVPRPRYLDPWRWLHYHDVGSTATKEVLQAVLRFRKPCLGYLAAAVGTAKSKTRAATWLQYC